MWNQQSINHCSWVSGFSRNVFFNQSNGCSWSKNKQQRNLSCSPEEPNSRFLHNYLKFSYLKWNWERSWDLDEPKSAGAGGDAPHGGGLDVGGWRPQQLRETARSRCNSTCHFRIWNDRKLETQNLVTLTRFLLARVWKRLVVFGQRNRTTVRILEWLLQTLSQFVFVTMWHIKQFLYLEFVTKWRIK